MARPSRAFPTVNPETVNRLIAAHHALLIPLETVAEHYLGLTRAEALREASHNRLPFPTVQLRDSQKAPRLVHVEDLAIAIDQLAPKARQQWLASQQPATPQDELQ